MPQTGRFAMQESYQQLLVPLYVVKYESWLCECDSNYCTSSKVFVNLFKKEKKSHPHFFPLEKKEKIAQKWYSENCATFIALFRSQKYKKNLSLKMQITKKYNKNKKQEKTSSIDLPIPFEL
ncbi:hypothetical protein RFI_12813 [Reticulomyxa filosa]|uniref:Uncharacterized protein n=1 Tax=Reticulomyxa filosa TaxID=46433 RepID=X6NF11_RETFI|nr:hypothetical protein RFI_12813 [Reticulomyxa filosa]|eukprot:ETO24344.1 hypothetical protein RFI_12813 [Reticulomyxa filosa]